jgi:hypothetical protein
MFPTIGFLACQVLSIIGSQIEAEFFFSLAWILINLRRSKLQTEFFFKIIFVSKNWSNNPRVGQKSPYNLVKFIETDGDLG